MNKWTKLLQSDDYLSVKKLLKNEKDLEVENESGETVLAVALRHRCCDDVIDILIESGADTEAFDDEGVSIFDFAITYNRIDLVKKLIECGRDVSKTHRRSGFTPLMAAVSYGRFEIFKLLLENDVDINAVESKGMSALDFAIKMHKKTMIKALQEKGAKSHF